MKIETLLDYQTILANQAQPVHFAIRFDAAEIGQPRPRPAAFCLVLDRSGSMAGEPLQRAKEAAQLVVRNLRAEDQFSLVTFDNEAQTVIPLQSPQNRAAWINTIGQIQSGGSTNLTGGWMLGRDELKKVGKESSRRLLLLSDGQLNVGVVEPGMVQRVVAAGLEQDAVRTSCLGFGSDYNEDLMAECARVTGGQFYDAQSAEKLPAIFTSELEGLQQLVVQNLRVRFKRLDFCDSAVLLGQYPLVTLPDGRKEIAVGDLVGGETRILCFELGVLPLPLMAGQPVCSLEGEQLVALEFLYDEISATGITSQTVTQVIRIQATQDPAEVKVREEVVSWVALQKAGRTIDEVTRQMDAGRQVEADQLLEQTIEQLRGYGNPQQVAEAVQQLENLRGLLGRGMFSLAERKSSKYRSASYLKMSSSEMWSRPEAPPSFKRKSGVKPATGSDATKPTT
jgi:Ca-activated chloride channel family protein